MNSIIEAYRDIYKQVEDINAQIDAKNAQLVKLSEEGNARFPERIENLEVTLEKIDDYLLRVKGFQELAKKNLESTNVLTIEAPPGYRVNLNRLRNWSMLIDPTSSNDPYAQRVYVVAKCDECFLEQKKVEFTQKLEALKNADASSFSEELENLKSEIAALNTQLHDFSTNEKMQQFAQEVIQANEQYWIQEAPEVYSPDTTKDAFAPGAVMMPFKLHQDTVDITKAQFGKFYDEHGKRVLLPFELSYAKDYVLTIACSPSRSKQIDKGIQNILMNYISAHNAGEKRIYVLDAARYNSNALGTLRAIEGSAVLNQIPRNPEQLTSTLEEIVSQLSDYDDIIELYDSVREYNDNSAANATALPTSLLVLYGWPNSFSKEDRELVKKIMMNYERYGLSVITVSFSLNEQDVRKLKESFPEYAANNATSIVLNSNESTITEPEKRPHNFTWYVFNSELKPDFVRAVNEYKVLNNKKGNEYTTWFSLAKNDLPEYTREYKQLSLPFGMDAKENIHELSFENENFAAYLVGASRSGKSTLLHTLIAGIIRNYHPDNVELWLADFKQLEFKKYIENCPPHVKYVLLDESTELVFNLIDKLTEKMMERQRLFSRLKVERIDQIDPRGLEEPVPLIFVILDEFSIMSQSIAESELYRLKLQNLLAKGAALGIRFLFSSQTFTTGIAGLTPTARAQIQQRISMKGSKEEISETLELSANLKTEQVKNWIDALPPHYALVKFRTGPDTPPQVKRFLVMYFSNYAVRDAMIQQIDSKMQSVETYKPNAIHTYVNKHRVFVDGNSFDVFPDEGFENLMEQRRGKSDYSAQDISAILGTPRLMESSKPILFTPETRENSIMICRNAEQPCGASIITSIIKSTLKQGKKVCVWAYEKNSMYRFCRENVWKDVDDASGICYSVGMEQICQSILQLKKAIMDKETNDVMYVLLGMDRIYSDFEFFDGSVGGSNSSDASAVVESLVKDQEKELKKKGVIATSEIEKLKAERTMQWVQRRKALEKEFTQEGKSKQEIGALMKAARDEFFNVDLEALASVNESEPKDKQVEPEVQSNSDTQKESGAYDAAEDFQFVIKQGSRFGYHFAMVLNDYSDVKSAGIRMEWFRHRLAFQISADDSVDMFGKRIASTLPEHICQYSDSLTSFSFRPYLHKGISWDGWTVDEDGKIISPY